MVSIFRRFPGDALAIDDDEQEPVACVQDIVGEQAPYVVAEFFEIPTVLVVDDSTHAHSSDNVSLTQTHVLSVADAVHGHSSDNVSLTQTHVLSVADAVHWHSSDNVSLTQTHVLSVADAVHGHSSDNVTLTQSYFLVVQDAMHAHFSDSCVLTTGEVKSITVETISMNEVQVDCIMDQSAETATKVLSQVQINGTIMSTTTIISSVQLTYSVASEVLP